MPGRIEESFLRRLEALPDDARLLLLVAAAEPVDDPLLVWRAAERLGIGFSAAAADATEGLLAIGERVSSVTRSCARRSTGRPRRRSAGRCTLPWREATDAAGRPGPPCVASGPGSTAPDERVAVELERSAARAQARGGLGAAAAFLERGRHAVARPSRRAARLLAAAARQARCRCARRRAETAQRGRLRGARRARARPRRDAARADRLRPVPRWARRRGYLAGAARRLEPVAVGLARKTHLEALGAAMCAGDRRRPGRNADHRGSRAARAPAARLARGERRAARGLRPARDQGAPAAAPSLRRARELLLAPHPATDDHGHWLWFAVAGNAITVAQELWDADAWRALTARHEQFARDSGALVQLQFALNMVAWVHVLAGELTESAQALEEERMIAEATGNRSISYTEMLVAAWRGQERRAAELIEATMREAPPRGRVACFAAYASAVLHNGLGRHAEARDARSIGLRAGSSRVRAVRRARAGRGRGQDRRRRVARLAARMAHRANARDAAATGRWGSRPGSAP